MLHCTEIGVTLLSKDSKLLVSRVLQYHLTFFQISNSTQRLITSSYFDIARKLFLTLWCFHLCLDIAFTPGVIWYKAKYFSNIVPLNGKKERRHHIQVILYYSNYSRNLLFQALKKLKIKYYVLSTIESPIFNTNNIILCFFLLFVRGFGGFQGLWEIWIQYIRILMMMQFYSVVFNNSLCKNLWVSNSKYGH